MNLLHPIVIITGPTASGKSVLAEIIAQQINGEIINADVGQFYVPTTIGTAKPAFNESTISYHLFDILNMPSDLTVVDYRNRVDNVCSDLEKKNIIPIIVGGSIFYIKSLLYPPLFYEKKASFFSSINFDQDTAILWEILNNIDPIRATQLHPHDRYRIIRALTIWQQTGRAPSHFKPKFKPIRPTILIVLIPPLDLLCHQINDRTQYMVENGWIIEAEKLLNTPWESFIEKKGLIGYPEIFHWIRGGKSQEQLSKTITEIAQKTRQYAKKQIKFLKMLLREINQEQSSHQKHAAIGIFNNVGVQEQASILSFIRERLHK